MCGLLGAGQKELKLVFTFRLEGEPAPYPLASIFEPPNHFVIVSKPKKPYVVLEPDIK
jgi:hypothetical protein